MLFSQSPNYNGPISNTSVSLDLGCGFGSATRNITTRLGRCQFSRSNGEEQRLLFFREALPLRRTPQRRRLFARTTKAVVLPRHCFRFECRRLHSGKMRPRCDSREFRDRFLFNETAVGVVIRRDDAARNFSLWSSSGPHVQAAVNTSRRHACKSA